MVSRDPKSLGSFHFSGSATHRIHNLFCRLRWSLLHNHCYPFWFLSTFLFYFCLFSFTPNFTSVLFKKKKTSHKVSMFSVPIRTCIHWVVRWSPDNVDVKLNFSLKIYLFLLYVYEDFVYIYVCVSCVCSVSVETSRRHKIPGTSSWKRRRATIWVLEIKLGFSTRGANT